MKLAALFVMVTFSSFGATLYCGPSNTGGGTGADFSNLIQFTDGTGFSRANEYVLVDGSYGARTLSEPVSGTTVISIRKASAADSAVAGYSSTLHDGQASFAGLTFTTDYWLIDGVTRDENQWGQSTTAYGIRTTRVYTLDYMTDSGGNNVTIQYCDIGETYNESPDNATIDAYNSGIVYNGGFDANITGWTISRCFIHNAKGTLFQFAGVSGNIVEYCWIGPGWGKEAIRGQGAASDVIIRYNVFYQSSQTDPNDGSSGITAEIGMWDYSTTQSGVQIYGNIFYSNKSGGRNAVIVVGGDGSGWVGSGSDGTVCYNNTFAGMAENSTFTEIDLNGSGTVARNNLGYDMAGTFDVGAATTSNNSEESSDPFVNYAGGNFHLAAALAGTSLSSPYNADMDGVTRGSDGVFDRGAFEYDAGVPPTPNTPRVHGGIRGFRGF